MSVLVLDSTPAPRRNTLAHTHPNGKYTKSTTMKSPWNQALLSSRCFGIIRNFSFANGDGERLRECRNFVPSENELSLLHFAISEHKLKAAAFLVDDMEMPVNEQSHEKRWNSAHWAVFTKQCHFIYKLSEHRVDLNQPDVDGHTPLHLAIMYNELRCIEAILGGQVNFNARYGTDKQSYIHYAARLNVDEMTDEMIRELYASVGASVTPEEKASLRQAFVEAQMKTIKTLTAAGADVNAFNANTMTALSEAIDTENMAVCRVLVTECNADVCRADSTAVMPLMAAVRSSKTEVVELLLQQSQRIKDCINSRVNETGNSVLHQAVLNNDAASEQIVKLLLDAGATADLRNNDGNSALHLAVLNNSNVSKKIINLLLEGGASPDVKNNEEKTPLDMAQEPGYEDLLECLTWVVIE